MTSRMAYGLRVLAGAIALFGLAACQLAPPHVAAKTGNVVSASAASGERIGIIHQAAPVSASATSVVLWGEVPKQCTWHVDALARVASELNQLQIGGGFKVESATTGWQVFSVTFDPRIASRDQVRKAIENGGGTILSGPPTPSTP